MADADLAELRKQCVTSLYLCTDNVCKYLEDEAETEYSKLKSYVGDYCLLEAQQEVAFQALEKAKNETDVSNVSTIEDRFKQHLGNLAGKRLNVNNHPYMLELKKRYEKGQQGRRQTMNESDLAITESQDQYIDPITKQAIVDPVKNTVCGHIYEKEAIINLINIRSRTKCPVAGCGNKGPILMEHLMSDDELRFRVALTQHSTMINDPLERSVTNLDDDSTQ